MKVAFEWIVKPNVAFLIMALLSELRCMIHGLKHGYNKHRSGHIAYQIKHSTYQKQHITHKFAQKISEIRHITCKIANSGGVFGHGAYIFGCKMDEY